MLRFWLLPAVVSLAVVTPTSPPQKDFGPQFLEKAGKPLGIGVLTEGGQLGIAIDESGSSKPKRKPVKLSFFPGDNAPILQDAAKSVGSPDPYLVPQTFSYEILSPRDPSSGQSTGRSLSISDGLITAIKMPGMARGKNPEEPIEVTISGDVSEAKPMAPRERKGGGGQFRSYTGGRFALELKGAVVSVSEIGPVTIDVQVKNGQSTSGQRALMVSPTTTTSIDLYVDGADAAPFYALYRDQLNGQSSGVPAAPFPFVLTYYDRLSPLAALRGGGIIESIGPVDPLEVFEWFKTYPSTTIVRTKVPLREFVTLLSI